jgi:hypothetical protein
MSPLCVKVIHFFMGPLTGCSCRDVRRPAAGIFDVVPPVDRAAFVRTDMSRCIPLFAPLTTPTSMSSVQSSGSRLLDKNPILITAVLGRGGLIGGRAAV